MGMFQPKLPLCLLANRSAHSALGRQGYRPLFLIDRLPTTSPKSARRRSSEWPARDSGPPRHQLAPRGQSPWSARHTSVPVAQGRCRQGPRPCGWPRRGKPLVPLGVPAQQIFICRSGCFRRAQRLRRHRQIPWPASRCCRPARCARLAATPHRQDPARSAQP